MQSSQLAQPQIRVCALAAALCMMVGALVVAPLADARGAHSSNGGARRVAPSTARPVQVHPQPQPRHVHLHPRHVHRAPGYFAPISPWLAWPATVYPYAAYGPSGHFGPFFEAPYPARVTVQVAALPKGGRVEIEAVIAL